MNEDKAKIFLDRILERIDNGEFDEHLKLPFASKKLLKILVQSRMERKVESGTTPVISDRDIFDYIEELKETSAVTAGIFLKAGILIKGENGLETNPKWARALNSL